MRGAVEGVDVLTGGVGGMAIGRAVAEFLNLPFVVSHLQPIGFATGGYPGVLFPKTAAWSGNLANRVGHILSDAALWLPFRASMAKVRRDLFGFEGRRGLLGGLPTLYGFSRHVVPMANGPLRCVTGYWQFPAPESWRPTKALMTFLQGENPVVSCGFGSMGTADPVHLTEMVMAAADAVDVRVCMQTDWKGTSQQPTTTLFPARNLPHQGLFPRMVANIHHGGAGTTGASIASGRPYIVVPFAVDQPFWGMRVHQLGIGPVPIPPTRLDQKSLKQTLQIVLDNQQMQIKARAFGQIVMAEEGITNAVQVFDQLVLPPK